MPTDNQTHPYPDWIHGAVMVCTTEEPAEYRNRQIVQLTEAQAHPDQVEGYDPDTPDETDKPRLGVPLSKMRL